MVVRRADQAVEVVFVGGHVEGSRITAWKPGGKVAGMASVSDSSEDCGYAQ